MAGVEAEEIISERLALTTRCHRPSALLRKSGLGLDKMISIFFSGPSNCAVNFFKPLFKIAFKSIYNNVYPGDVKPKIQAEGVCRLAAFSNNHIVIYT